jgi:hypothetical protein
MTTADQVLRRARTQLGVAESPAGSNQVLYADWYGLKGPWCAMFVSWCTFLEGLPLAASTRKGFAYTPAGAQWFKRQGRWSERPAPGHVVFYDFPGDDIRRISHVGLVESVEDDGTIVVIEGNTDERGGRTGGKVMRRRRRSGIVGYGVPAYDTESGPGVPPLASLLRVGSISKDVRLLQARLGQWGAVGLAVDGEFGPLTEQAVRTFQAGHGLEVDGVVGPETWTALWAPATRASENVAVDPSGAGG